MMNFFRKYLYSWMRLVWLLVKPMSLGVRLLMVRDGKVLLVRHVYQDQWFLPGGLVEPGETLAAAARREALEEVGASLHDLTLFGVYSHRELGKINHVVVFLSRQFELNGRSDSEIEQYAFFDRKALPADVSAASRWQIERLDTPDPQATYKDW
ncbi:MAG: NUDIX domain-containing protein [Anaerolineae bacterium]|nr:MAG: NUDIX domain-containing protein [Anaerolineae bacterium]